MHQPLTSNTTLVGRIGFEAMTNWLKARSFTNIFNELRFILCVSMSMKSVA